MAQPVVSIIMGSASDLPIMEKAGEVLKELEVPFEMTVVSAHRTPERLWAYAHEAEGRGIRVIIAGAGGAAHLPGMVASMTPLPVVGVPVKARISIDGWDSVLSILQMPPGVPVATVALDGGRSMRQRGCFRGLSVGRRPIFTSALLVLSQARILRPSRLLSQALPHSMTTTSTVAASLRRGCQSTPPAAATPRQASKTPYPNT